MPGGQRHHRRLQSRPERRSRDQLRQPALVRARQCRQRNWCVRAQSSHAVGGNSEIWWRPKRRRPALLDHRPARRRRSGCDRRSHRSDLRPRVAICTLVLADRQPAPLALPPPSSFAFARASAAAAPLRWIHRRSPGARPRVLTRLLLQSLQAILMLANRLARSTMNSTHAHAPRHRSPPPPRVHAARFAARSRHRSGAGTQNQTSLPRPGGSAGSRPVGASPPAPAR